MDQSILQKKAFKPCRLCLTVVLLLMAFGYGWFNYWDWRPGLSMEELEQLIVDGDVERVQIVNTRAEVYLTDAAVFSERHPRISRQNGRSVGPHYYAVGNDQWAMTERIERAAQQAPRQVSQGTTVADVLLVFIFGLLPVLILVSGTVFGVCWLVVVMVRR